MALQVPLPFSHVLHIGAGTGDGAEAYLAAGLDPIVLVDADPECVADLRRLAAGRPAVRAVQAAVSARPGPHTFYRTNFSDLNGLGQPGAALKALFPGLEVLAGEPVSATAPEVLAAKAGLPQDGAGLLVIEAPGEAAGILEALARAGLLAGFRSVRVQDGLQPLCAGAPPLAEVQEQLLGLGFESWLEPQPEDPDRPYVFAVRMDRLRGRTRDLKELAQALEASHETAAVLAEERDRAGCELELLKARCDEAEAAAARQAQALDEAGAARDSARSEAEGLAARVAELETEAVRQAQALDEAGAVRDSARSEAEGLAARVAELETEAARQAQALDEAGAARDSARSEAEGLAARVAELETEAVRQAQALDEAGAVRDSARSEAEGLAARVAELETETARQAQALDEAGAARDSARSEAEGLAARVAELETEAARRAQALDEAGAARDSARSEAEGLAARVAELETETARQAHAWEKAAASEADARQAQQNLATALRLQSRREADLKELQARYSALLQRQEELEDLLQRTGACLGYLMEDAAPSAAEAAREAAEAQALNGSSA